jgi:hypothetical protein
MLTQRTDIEKWLDEMNIQNYIINQDLTVNVTGHVNLQNKDLDCIPIQFNKVSGGFCCRNNLLTSLKGTPRIIDGSFECEYNLLTDYQYVPMHVGHSFVCSGKIDLMQLIDVFIGDNFAHFYQHEGDKILLLSKFYAPFANGQLVNIPMKEFSQAMNIVKTMKEKELLETTLLEKTMQINKIKI